MFDKYLYSSSLAAKITSNYLWCLQIEEKKKLNRPVCAENSVP